MKLEHPYLIQDLPGLTPHLSRLVRMMAYARQTTLEAVEGLSRDQLDVRLHDDGNSIGMLLEHMAAVEVYYQTHTFENRYFNNEEKARWGAGADLGDLGREKIKGHDLEYYLENLAAVREKTLAEFARRDDAWLHEETTWVSNQPANAYFKWFHVFEDEINHRGQIRLIRKALKQQSS